METKYLEIGDNDWGVIVILDFDVDREHDDLLAIMRSFGLTRKNAERALNILSNYNTGMAVSVDDLRMSAIFIAKTTNNGEFWSTLNHELYHVCTAIIDYYGEPYDQEPAAYLQGELMRQAVLSIGEPCF